jgi:nitrogen fixation/metabolism regulation signal transduction histidine kinase
VRFLFVAPFVCFCVLLFVVVNLLLHYVVISPVERIARTAEVVSMGDMSAPEYSYASSDQLGRLSDSFNRMRRSLQEAMRLLDDPSAS